jgi:hypothetical protein
MGTPDRQIRVCGLADILRRLTRLYSRIRVPKGVTRGSSLLESWDQQGIRRSQQQGGMLALWLGALRTNNTPFLQDDFERAVEATNS